MSKQLYAAPVPYCTTATNHPEITALRVKVRDAEAALRLGRSRRNVTAREMASLDEALRKAKDELYAAERAKDNERQRQRTGTNDARPAVTQQEAARREQVLDAHDVIKAAVNALSESQRITLINGRRTLRGEPKLKVCCTGQYKCSRCKAASA